MKRPGKERLDTLLVRLGHFESRENARRAIMAGQVRMGDCVADKPGMLAPVDARITVAAPPKYVGRGGFKLEAALDHFQIDVAGRTCLDVGASTGGFTDCLLQRGAGRVHAIDVGHSQLDWKIRADPRVIVQEKVNARHLTSAHVPEPVDVAVVDVSFISLTLVLSPVLELLSPDGVAVTLIKPQFELARGDVGKGGIVRDPFLHQKAVSTVETYVRQSTTATWAGVMESPILGAHGNREFLACLRR